MLASLSLSRVGVCMFDIIRNARRPSGRRLCVFCVNYVRRPGTGDRQVRFGVRIIHEHAEINAINSE